MQEETDDDFGPSRSAQRRDALAVLAFAERLVAQSPAWLDRASLPDDVKAEIATARRITAHGAHKRQLAFLAKVMRRHAPEDFAIARERLADDHAQQARDAAALHRLEALREALIADGDSALTPLLAAHPDADAQRLRALIRQARLQRDRSQPPAAAREIFRLLRALVATD